ncbi:MAG: hypothetical protein RLZZ127_148 [Planctomycetota bacterium]|jgi:arylsulfatase A-like enzyme
MGRVERMTTRPNIVLINADDLGFGDLGCYGSTANRTPHLDRMAAEGLRLTSFYQASPVCSPSRGGMLTGCWPKRIGFERFLGYPVLFPAMPVGLHPEERTFAAVLRDAGYATALVGKWHCGDQRPFLPTAHGFDRYFGLPYSNDMGRQAGDRAAWIARLQSGPGMGSYRGAGEPLDTDYPPLPLLDGDRVAEVQPDQRGLSDRYLDASLAFIRERAAERRPFLLYLAPMYVHLPIYVPEPWLGRSGNGRYGAAVEHLDHMVGAVLSELVLLGIDRETLVIFTSDNGSRVRGEGGSNGPLRGTKATSWEGGQRVPCIARWLGVIPAGRVADDLACGIDLLPTFAALAGVRPPEDRTIDGRDLGPFLRGEAASPRDTMLYWWRGHLAAVRVGGWKLHVRRDGAAVRELYDLAADPGEARDRIADEPAVAARLDAAAAAVRAELGDGDLDGPGCRPLGRVAAGEPLTRIDPADPRSVLEYDLADAG